MRIAADKFCAIANRTAPISVTAGVSLSSVLTSARTEGSSVISQIWYALEIAEPLIVLLTDPYPGEARWRTT